MKEKPVVICDFDGTISVGDVGEMLIEHFLGERWRALDDLYHDGRYGMIELYRRSFDEIGADEADFERFVAGRAIDPDFPVFLAACRAAELDVLIVSDGFDFYIGRLLERAGLGDIPLHSNRLAFEDGSLRLEFPNPHESCTDCANCKQKIVDILKERGSVVYVGNGLSDCCAAKGADLVYAKDSLAEHFAEEGLAFERYSNFGDVLEDFIKRGILESGE